MWDTDTPRWRRVLKQVLVLAIFVLLDVFAGRMWVFGLLALMGGGALYVHGWWLPAHGINGWTAEPYDVYLSLITKTPREDARCGSSEAQRPMRPAIFDRSTIIGGCSIPHERRASIARPWRFHETGSAYAPPHNVTQSLGNRVAVRDGGMCWA